MAANPLMERVSSRPGRVTTEVLHDLATDLNREPFVKAMGRFYRVGREMIDGNPRHFLTWDSVSAR